MRHYLAPREEGPCEWRRKLRDDVPFLENAHHSTSSEGSPQYCVNQLNSQTHAPNAFMASMTRCQYTCASRHNRNRSLCCGSSGGSVDMCPQTMRWRIELMKKIARSLRHRVLILNCSRAQKLISSGILFIEKLAATGGRVVIPELLEGFPEKVAR